MHTLAVDTVKINQRQALFASVFICTLLYFHHHVWIKLVDELIQLFDQRIETWPLP